ncbi:hypothetical protein CAOG_009447, partial [Capsaspora owczarzaki ATCC 30864]
FVGCSLLFLLITLNCLVSCVLVSFRLFSCPGFDTPVAPYALFSTEKYPVLFSSWGMEGEGGREMMGGASSFGCAKKPNPPFRADIDQRTGANPSHGSAELQCLLAQSFPTSEC